MEFQIARHFEDADANSLTIELFCDDDQIVRAWYIGPLIRMAKEFLLPFVPREQNLRAEAAIARVVEIALAAELSVTLIDPFHLWEELWFSDRRSDRFSALLAPPVETPPRRRRRQDLLAARDNGADGPRRKFYRYPFADRTVSADRAHLRATDRSDHQEKADENDHDRLRDARGGNTRSSVARGDAQREDGRELDV